MEIGGNSKKECKILFFFVFFFLPIFMLGFDSEPNSDEYVFVAKTDERFEFLGEFYMRYSVLKII